AGAFAAFVHAQVEQQRQAGAYPDDLALERVDQGGVQAASGALVGMAGIGEAVAEHPGTAYERRLDGFAHVLGARGEHQQQFGLRARRFVRWIQQQLADAFGQRGAAGLTRAHHLLARGLQFAAQRFEHSGLAGALAAFQRHEAPMRANWRGWSRGHCAWAWRCARYRRRYSRTAAWCSGKERVNTWRPLPSPTATKYGVSPGAGWVAACTASAPGIAIGVGGSPARE